MQPLTKAEREAVVAVLLERVAGSTQDLRDAIGLTNRQAITMMHALERALDKLCAED